MPLLLTGQLLDELQARWRREGAIVAEVLRPGLEIGVIERAMRPLGLTLPLEARLWWGWHDGTERTTHSQAIGLDLLFLPLERAVSNYQRQMDIARRVANGDLDPDEIWPPGWFPLISKLNGSVIACDCSVRDDEPTPIHHYDHEFPDQALEPVAESLGDLVGRWIDALDSGAWRFNHALGVWDREPDRLPDSRLKRVGGV